MILSKQLNVNKLDITSLRKLKHLEKVTLNESSISDTLNLK
jgi:hypothetical protein